MRCAPFLLLFLATAAQAEDLGLRVPKNFKVTLWADHTLANDIYTMALDEKGHVVVSGPGYIRRLEDTDGDGKADKAIDIAKTKTGAMGLLFAQDVLNKKKFVLYATQDGGISEFERTDSSPEFQSFVERALKLPSSEHGGHALRSGPDGSFFAVGGNNSGLGTWDSLPYSPNTKAEAGGFIHFPGWRLTNSKVIAHGFRNPYDFDFTPLGDIITFDSDTERDYLLPWYTPTRVYHVLPGAHHGWRLPGGSRSLARRDFYPDTVAPLANMGRGSPTGVCCYQHTQFPVHYRGGVFLLDWTFGKIHYLPLIPEGSSYQHVTPELFLEAVGNNGFAPTAARVAPDGSLFVSIGGRGTRGAVYRIEYLVNGEFPQIPKAKAEQAIDLVLDAPQPTEAWSQATWVPLVEQISTEELEGVFLEELQPDHRRTRAMDIHVMKSLKALQAPIAQALIRSKSSIVRAHTARFMLDRYGQEDWESLWILTLDESPRVRCEALLCICQICDFRPERRKLADSGSLARCLVDDDRRVRLAACRLLSLLTDTDFSKIERLMKREKSSRGVVSTIVARCWNGPQKTLSKALFLDAAAAYEFAKSPTERVEAIRALMLTLGDWNISNSRVEALCGYTVHLAKPSDRSYLRLVSRELAIELTRRFPSRNEDENMESARLLAMMTSDGEQAYSKVLDQISETSHPTSDFHYLTVLTQLGSRRTSSRTESVANALLALDGKLQRRGLRVESNWYARLRELVLELLKTHPGLDLMLAAHKKLVSPGNVLVAMQLPLETRRAAAIRFFEVIHRDPDFPLSVESIRLLATLPPEKIRPFLRSRWSDRSTRAEIIEQLAQKPEEVDREKFLEFLATGTGASSVTCMEALMTLPRDTTATNLVPILLYLRQCLSDPKEKQIRLRLVTLLNRQSGQQFAISEAKDNLGQSYKPVFTWFEKSHPTEAKELTSPGEDEIVLRAIAKKIDLRKSNAIRGEKVFRDRGCQACHGSSIRLGPDLAGAGKRLSRDDLLTALVNPSRDVAPIYRVTHLDTKAGKRLSGILVYDSSETVMIQLANGETLRLPATDIESRSSSNKSLMPDDLLKGIKPGELADLFAYLENR